MPGITQYHTIPLPKRRPRRASYHALWGLNSAFSSPFKFAGALQGAIKTHLLWIERLGIKGPALPLLYALIFFVCRLANLFH